jgi:hypothetical protein
LGGGSEEWTVLAGAVSESNESVEELKEMGRFGRPDIWEA